MQNKISVVMATYNGAEFLKQQLDSILLQLPENGEIIISDDGSSDKTIDIIKQYNHAQIRLVKNMGPKGAKCNFENALNHVTGDIIFFSDQDDIWKPGKIAHSMKYMSEYDVLVSDCNIIDEHGNEVLASYFKRRNSGAGLLKNLWANTYLGCCLVINKKVLKIALPFPEDVSMHDIWIGFVGELFFKSYFLNVVLVSYRMHDKNISPTTVGISPHSLLTKLIFRWYIVKYFPSLLIRKWKK